MATTYTFKAMDLAGALAQGVVEAESKQDVANQLKERGLVVIDIAAKYRSKELNVELFARVKAKDLAVASRQLATMVTSGMPILRALYVQVTEVVVALNAGPRPGLCAGVLLPDDFAVVAGFASNVFVPHAGSIGALELPHRLVIGIVAVADRARVRDRVFDGAVAAQVLLHLEGGVRDPDRRLGAAGDQGAIRMTRIRLAEPRQQGGQERRRPATWMRGRPPPRQPRCRRRTGDSNACSPGRGTSESPVLRRPRPPRRRRSPGARDRGSEPRTLPPLASARRRQWRGVNT